MVTKPRALIVFLFVVFGLFSSCTEHHLAEIWLYEDGNLSWIQKEPCRLVVVYQGDTTNLLANARYRGGSSSRFYKHSFSVELDEKANLLDLPKDDDWIFNAGYIDKTFMRHKISFDLYRSMNIDNKAPKCNYFNFYFNNKFEGLYLLMEKINGGFLDLHKQDSLAVVFKDPRVFHRGDKGTPQDSLNPDQQNFPDLRIRDQSYQLEAFRDFMFNASDSLFAHKIGDYIDLKQVIDWHLLLSLSNNGDGILKNFYLYRQSNEAPFRIAIWDYDHSFGRDGDGTMNMMEYRAGFEKSILFYRLENCEKLNYHKLLKDRYRELRENGVFSIKNFHEMIAENHKIISNSLAANFDKWPADDKWYKDAMTYEEEVKLMKDFFQMRLKQMDEEFEYQAVN